MAKLKLTKLLKESLEEADEKIKLKKEMKFYARKMEKGLEKLRTLMRRDGYDV